MGSHKKGKKRSRGGEAMAQTGVSPASGLEVAVEKIGDKRSSKDIRAVLGDPAPAYHSAAADKQSRPTKSHAQPATGGARSAQDMGGAEVGALSADSPSRGGQQGHHPQQAQTQVAGSGTGKKKSRRKGQPRQATVPETELCASQTTSKDAGPSAVSTQQGTEQQTTVPTRVGTSGSIPTQETRRKPKRSKKTSSQSGPSATPGLASPAAMQSSRGGPFGGDANASGLNTAAGEASTSGMPTIPGATWRGTLETSNKKKGPFSDSEGRIILDALKVWISLLTLTCMPDVSLYISTWRNSSYWHPRREGQLQSMVPVPCLASLH